MSSALRALASMRLAGPLVFVGTVVMLLFCFFAYNASFAGEDPNVIVLHERFLEQEEMLVGLKNELERFKNRAAPKPEPLLFVHLSDSNKKAPQETTQSVFKPLPEAPLLYPELNGKTITYDECKASLRDKSAQKTMDNLHWIHIPKTGTSFGWTLFSYLCSEEAMAAKAAPGVDQTTRCNYCGQVKRGVWDRDLYKVLPFEKLPYCDTRVSVRGLLQNHLPVPRSSASTDNFVTLMRDPRRRAVSAYNHGKHSFGIGERNHATASVRREYMIQHTPTLKDFATFPDIQNCQTKMMLSEYCAIDMNISVVDEMHAKERLSKFAFVGITENFNLSVCLFHHMFGGPVHEFEFSPFRVSPPYIGPETGLLPGGSLRMPSEAWSSLAPSMDPHDWELYQHARAIFAANLRKHGLLK